MTPAAGEIEVWRIPLTGKGERHWLNGRERAFAASAVDPEVGRRRICARSALREILGAYVDTPPALVQLIAGAGGKPRLVDGPPFNLSHSGELMLLAISGVGEVGIDLEHEGRLVDDWGALAARAFSPAEQAEIAAMAPADQARAALRAWVRKEAYAKARGAGYAYGFPSFTVRTIAASAESLLAEDEQDPDAPSKWRLADLDAPDGFIASLAHAGGPAAIRLRDHGELT